MGSECFDGCSVSELAVRTHVIVIAVAFVFYLHHYMYLLTCYMAEAWYVLPSSSQNLCNGFSGLANKERSYGKAKVMTRMFV